MTKGEIRLKFFRDINDLQRVSILCKVMRYDDKVASEIDSEMIQSMLLKTAFAAGYADEIWEAMQEYL